MIILSFPPVRARPLRRLALLTRLSLQLFGHEFVAIFCGIVWGLVLGFAIVAAGTILGELCTY